MILSVTFPEVVQNILWLKNVCPNSAAQLRELHLDLTRRAPFDTLHDIGQGQFWRCRQEHVDVIAAQNALHDMYVHLCASLHDNSMCLTIK